MKVTLELDEAEAREVVQECRKGYSPLIADKIEAQLPKPKPAEPEEFGSVVQARLVNCADAPDAFVCIGYGESRAWTRGNGEVSWESLVDVTVLRVGVGTAPPSEELTEALIADYCNWDTPSLPAAEAPGLLRSFARALLRGDRE